MEYKAISTMHNIMHKMRLLTTRTNEVTMYMSEMLIRDQHSQRLKQAREARLAHQASELRHLRRLQQRARRQLREVHDRAEELGVTIGTTS